MSDPLVYLFSSLLVRTEPRQPYTALRPELITVYCLFVPNRVNRTGDWPAGVAFSLAAQRVVLASGGAQR